MTTAAGASGPPSQARGDRAAQDPAWRAGVARAWPLVGLLACVVWLTWPCAAGIMPRSADHPVHLARIAMFEEVLASGALRGFSAWWALGVPVGELYPIGGDLLIVGLRAASFGAVELETAYAWGLVVVSFAWGTAVYGVARLLGVARAFALAAAVLACVDPGSYREGGWIYTMEYGVWPQTLAMAFVWLAFVVLARRLQGPKERSTGRIVAASLLIAGAVLSHPMALPVLVVGGALLCAVSCRAQGVSGGQAVALVVGPVLLGVGLASFYLVPMGAHRGFMANYGWLWQPLSVLAQGAALEGQWTANMPPVVGFAVSAAVLGAVVTSSWPLRFVVACALVLWGLAAQEAFWWPRLDRLGSSFCHVQYQRFLTAAKPGFFALAVVPVAALWRFAARRERNAAARYAGFVAASLLFVAVAWDAARFVDRHGVGKVSTKRFPTDTRLGERARDGLGDAEYDALVAYLRERWETRDGFFRVAFVVGRNQHFFMDLPVTAGIPIYKAGFTPGDNFVHKPESSRAEVLEAARVRYVVRIGAPGPLRGREVAAFGRFRVEERSPPPLVSLEGPGTLHVLEEDPFAGRVVVVVEGAESTSRLLFRVAGFPRFELRREGEPVPWEEVPIWGTEPPLSPKARLRGEVVSGKAWGDDGSEPILIRAEAMSGRYALAYRTWTRTDFHGVLGTVLAGLALAAVVACGRSGSSVGARCEGLRRRVVGFATPGRLRSVGACAAVVLGVALGLRWVRAAELEADRAVGWSGSGRGRELSGFVVGPLKADMLLRPALISRRLGTSTATFTGVPGGRVVHGWIAPDDDGAKHAFEGEVTLRIEAREEGQGDRPWVELVSGLRLPHRPGRQALALDLRAISGASVEVRVVLRATHRRPAYGFDLELGDDRGTVERQSPRPDSSASR